MRWDVNNCCEIGPKVWLHVFASFPDSGWTWTLSAGTGYSDCREFAHGRVLAETRIEARAPALAAAREYLRGLADGVTTATDPAATPRAMSSQRMCLQGYWWTALVETDTHIEHRMSVDGVTWMTVATVPLRPAQLAAPAQRDTKLRAMWRGLRPDAPEPLTAPSLVRDRGGSWDWILFDEGDAENAQAVCFSPWKGGPAEPGAVGVIVPALKSFHDPHGQPDDLAEFDAIVAVVLAE